MNFKTGNAYRQGHSHVMVTTRWSYNKTNNTNNFIVNQVALMGSRQLKICFGNIEGMFFIYLSIYSYVFQLIVYILK
jgi:hypothetical protein